MMALRFYIDQKITAKGGGDHSRIIDVADMDETSARELVSKQLTKHEQIGSVASITIDDPASHPVIS